MHFKEPYNYPEKNPNNQMRLGDNGKEKLLTVKTSGRTRPHNHLLTPAFPSLVLPPNTPSPPLFLCLWPTVSTGTLVMIVNPSPNRSGMEISFFFIRMFGLAKILCQMPSLTQPSPFIWALGVYRLVASHVVMLC